MCWSSWRLHGVWTQHRLSRLRGLEGNLCQLAKDQAGGFAAATSARLLQKERDMRVSQELRQAAGFLEAQHREPFARGCFLCHSSILPAGARQHACPVSWQLRRAGWAVVVVDEMGNIKSASYGAVPSDVLSEQTSRCAEDYAAMAGPLTLDPLTHRDDHWVEGKGLGSQWQKGSRLRQAALLPRGGHAVKVEGQATEVDVERYDEDRWEVQMHGVEVEARKEGKTRGRQMTMRQHYLKTIQKAMKHTQIPYERWHNEWRNVAPKKVDVQTKREATARW